MKKEVLEGGTPSRRRGSKTGSRKAGQSDRENSAKTTAGETILDDDVQIPDVGLEDEDIDLTEEIDSDELSDILEDMEQEATDDIASHLVKDEEDEESKNTRGLMKYPGHRPSRSKSSKVKREDVSEGIEEKPRTRWFMTTCLYCGNIYRFRSDEIQPPTCGKPQCIARFEERMKRKVAVA